ncbi:MAG TPA: hypothetical protein VHD62_06860 [Opitutaceae bacterium]|nr:hypothetical protein [Opitutaceae bacterium]
MSRLPVILNVVALLCAATLGALFFQTQRARRQLEATLADETMRASKLAASLAVAHEENAALKSHLGETESELGATKTKLAASDARATQLDRELAQAKSAIAMHERNAQALAAEIASLRQDLADARSSSASPEAVAAYKNTIAELERELAAAGNGVAAPNAAGAATAVFASRTGRGTVLSVGAENAFVVLDFGATRGATVGQKLTIGGGTDPIATVLISDVRPNFSIAQVLPDTLRGVLQKGDVAVLLR